MNDPAPLVSIVVVTLDALALLRRCLASLSRQDYAPIEIIVVDNGSSEDVRGMLAGEFPEARLVRLERNLGFAGGNNRGIAVARGKYVALINNDAVAEPGWIAAMVALAEGDEKIGAVGSVIIDGNEPEVLDSMGLGIALDGMSRQAMKGHRVEALAEPVEILLPSGCACLYRVTALREVGLFDESFFAYCEDTDLGLRLRRSGWAAYVAPGAVVTHYYSMTAGKSSLKKLFWVERNHYWVALRSFPLRLLLTLPVATLGRFCVQLLLLARGRSSLESFISQSGLARTLGLLLWAQICAMVRVPAVIVRRLASRSSPTIPDAEMMRLLLRFRLSAHEIIDGGPRCP